MNSSLSGTVTRGIDGTVWADFAIRSHAGDQYYNADKQGIHSNNAMFHGGSRYLNDRTSTKINPQQIQWIYNSYKRDLLNLN